MANELPYFRFTVSAWQNGKIGIESYELKGLFIDVCGYYWISDCNTTLTMLNKRFSNAKGLLELINLGIIKHENRHDKVEIEFLNIQYDLLSEKRKLRQVAGSKGGNAKAKLKQKPSYKDKDKDKDNLLLIFDSFRKKYPGTKNGNETEFNNFCKKHKDWKVVLPLLESAIDNQIYVKKNKQGFVPEWKNLQTWINQRCWEEETTSEVIIGAAHNYTDLQIREAKAFKAAGWGLPEWFDKKYESLLD